MLQMGVSRTRQRQAALVGQASPPGLTLLVSIFWLDADGVHDDASKQHRSEILAALAANLENPFVGAAHVLVDGLPDGVTCREALERELESEFLLAGPGAQGRTAAMLAKLRCKSVPAQPTYADFLMYANGTLAGRPVLLSNADVAFDDTLGLIDLDVIAARHVLLLSVRQPGEPSSYSRRFGHACDLWDKCAWTDERYTQSWDAYVFQPPFWADPRPGASFYMNIMKAEHYALHVINDTLGYSFTNGCMFVSAFHWHCSQKMHANHTWPKESPFIWRTFPCTNRQSCLGLRPDADRPS